MPHVFATALVVLAFVVTIGATVAEAQSQKTTPDAWALTHSLTDGRRGNFPKRFLRARKYTNNDEERATSPSTLENLVKSTTTTDELEAWLKRGDTTNYVFKALQLQKAGDGILGNPQLVTWISYMKLFNEANPTKKSSLITTLTAHFGNQGLTRIIEAGLLGSNTAIMAKRLQVEQVHHWMTQGRSPENVFGLLKLDKLLPFTWISSDLFEKPGLATWIKYLDNFNAENPAKKTTLITILSKRYNDKTLANMLIAANKAESTSSIAKRIQAEQTQLWLVKGKKPADIFTMLQLEKAGDTLFTNPLFAAWVKYADDFRLRHDTQLATMPTLTSHYSDEALAKMTVAAYEDPSTKTIAKRLQSELQRDWLFNGQAPNDVFIMMDLDRSMDKLLGNPLFSTWYKYGLYVNTMNPKIQWHPITALTQSYGGDKALTDMLMAAMKEPSTRSVATELLSLQVSRWVSKKKTPAQVFSFLGAEGAAADDVSSILYKKYAAGYEEYMRLFPS
ncbi:hypothetical protein PHYPSEUDO_013850 [Phytophthora pseudosyringae]|uniref:RxLR effector PexRD54 WY domain-containing protein n=1 Tax=Phytophthora pseudosyringae TaxID=221518 RepID=A0A8T1V7G3_9STRA|nr:hypothetical protein PHYPSEUDO_013850 [Phytophthora pseudosyringae]